MGQSDKITAAILIIGDEILSGRTLDENSGYIARHLASIGITLAEIRTVSDQEADIVAATNDLRTIYDYLFTTGGIGPTHDDITADSMAAAFGLPIDVDTRALDMMRRFYSEEDLSGDRLRMARIPQGAKLIDNPISHTPGFILENVVVMAGIPQIMQVMLDKVTPDLRKGLPFLTRTVRVLVVESQIVATLQEVQDLYLDVSLGSYPFLQDKQLGSHLVLRSAHEKHLAKAVRALVERLEGQGLDPRLIDN